MASKHDGKPGSGRSTSGPASERAKPRPTTKTGAIAGSASSGAARTRSKDTAPQHTGSKRTGAKHTAPKIMARAAADGSPTRSAGAQPTPARAAGGDKNEDLILVHGKSELGWHVLRKKGDELSLGAMKPLEEGKPIDGEVVKLSPREEHPMLFDAETQLPAPRASSKGPPQVATQAYRDGWNAIWGKKRRSKTDRPN